MRDPALEQEVAQLYSDALPYHNFAHALQVVEAGEDIVNRCRTEGIRVDRQVVYYANLFHDAGFHEDHVALGFDCKEAYSAHLAAECLRARGVYERTIDKVVAAVLATRRDASFHTAEQKAVRAADLAGLAADFEDFLENSRRLRRETELLSGRRIAWRDWLAQVQRTLGYYLTQEIRLTSYFTDSDGESAFHQGVRRNLALLMQTTEQD